METRPSPETVGWTPLGGGVWQCRLFTDKDGPPGSGAMLLGAGGVSAQT